MELVVVAIYDAAANGFHRPAFVQTKGIAMRSFADEVNRRGDAGNPNPIFDHPADYSLYFLGMYDDGLGKFVSCPTVPELMVRADTLVQSYNRGGSNVSE